MAVFPRLVGVVPRRVALVLLYPLFVCVANSLRVGRLNLQYLGGGEFVFVGDIDDHARGRLVVYVTFLPLIYYIILFIPAFSLASTKIWVFLIICVFSAGLVVFCRAMEEVTIRRFVVGGDAGGGRVPVGEVTE